MKPNQAASATTGRVLWAVLASLAIAFPTVIAYNVAPSATFFNQAAAFVGWGGFLMVLAASFARRAMPASSGSFALLGSLGILIAAALAASVFAAVPWALSLSSAGTMLAAVLAVAVAASAQRAGLGERAFLACCVALTVAGIASSAIGLIQVFAPNLPDGEWVAVAAIAGRATGNLRQPNHLSSLLLWSIVAVLWLGERRVIYREIAAVLAVLFVWVVMLSASRTGAIGVATLAVWGLLDRRLSRTTRLVLLALPVAFALLWGGTAMWAHATQQAFGAEARFTGSGIYVSYSRYGIWANALSMIAMHPWLGVGFGEFNFAWTLTPFPDRPVAFFDHAHNIALQFAVELGLPLATAVLALMSYALWQAWRNARDAGRAPSMPLSRLRSGNRERRLDSSGTMQRAAFVMVLMAGMHSLLEYPLWYAYFLLPVAFFFGLCLERPGQETVTADAATDAAGDASGGMNLAFVVAGIVLVLGGALALADYRRVVVIFEPPADAAPLDKRIAAGRRSIFFAHHADYAAATVAEHPGKVMNAFERAPHYLLDARLMQAWAVALNENGETDKASYVARRLKEFRNEQSAEFFAPCTAASASAPAYGAAGGGLAFQCRAPVKPLAFEDFR